MNAVGWFAAVAGVLVVVGAVVLVVRRRHVRLSLRIEADDDTTTQRRRG